MKIGSWLIIAFSLAFSNNNGLVRALDGTLDNITALTDWSNQVYINIGLIVSTQVSDEKLVPEIPYPQIIIDGGVNAERCSVLLNSPTMRQNDEALKNLAMNLDVIDRFYRDFNTFSKQESTFDNITLKRWATSITSNAIGDLPDVLWKIHRSIAPENDFTEGLFMVISRILQENNDNICDIGVSPQYCLYSVYQDVMDRQTKAYIMTLYAYEYFRKFENRNFDSEKHIVKDEFVATSGKLLKAVFGAMNRAPQDQRLCDPEKHERNSTFLELEGLMQTYLVHKWNLNPSLPCDVDCSSRYSGPIAKDDDYTSTFKPNRICEGDLIWCRNGGSFLRACQLPKDNIRRFKWFKNEQSVYGSESDCNDGTLATFSGWISLLGHKCDYCMCTCMQDKVGEDLRTIRAISFMDQMSDIRQNRVVVGLKFISKYGLIHVQILQARLLARGRIDNTNLEWIPIKQVHYLPNSSEGSGEKKYNIWTEDNEKAEPGKHYGPINRDQRQMNLDDILLPDNYVVTGVRFRHSKGQAKDLPIELEVHGTPIDYASGKLVPTKERGSMWFNVENMGNKYSGSYRQEVEIENPENPVNYVNHVPNSKPNSYIKFTRTDIEKDAGQATVPFFDARQVGGSMNYPLSGIGLFHRGHPPSGGFLAFRIYGIDITQYMGVPE